MKAVVIHQFGTPDVFQVEEIPKPQVTPGHVLIKVAASSVNPIDFKIRSGAVKAVAPSFPAILHGDVAGVIEAVGEGVTKFQPGDEVYGCAGGIKGLSGALADYMLADADLIALKPKSLSMVEAATLPLVTITSWLGLFDRAQLRAEQQVLIHAATGGVGHIAIQLAKSAGAKVYTTGSTEEKLAHGRKLGADAVINYREQAVADYVEKYTDGRGFDLVYDTIGGQNLDRSFEAAAVNGTVVAIATRSTHDLAPVHAKGLTLHVVFMLIPLIYGPGRARYSEILSQAARLVDEGKLSPLIDRETVSFEAVGQAHARLEAGQALGKIALVNNLG